MKAPLPLPMESGPPGNQHLAGSLEQTLLSTGSVWPDHPTDGGVSQGIPGPEDTESAWRGGVRKDGEGGRVRGFQGKWTESRGVQLGGGEVDQRKNRLREKK